MFRAREEAVAVSAGRHDLTAISADVARRALDAAKEAEALDAAAWCAVVEADVGLACRLADAVGMRLHEVGAAARRGEIGVNAQGRLFRRS